MTLLAAFAWGPEPDAFHLGPLVVRWYGLFFAAGFLASFWIVRRAFAREGRPVEDVERLLVTTMIGTVVGARLVHCFVYEPRSYLANPAEILRVWHGGLASHGGMLGIVAALWFHARRRADQPFLWLLDRVSIAAAVAGAFVRLGNFVNSEIYGTPTDGPFGIVFTRVDGPAGLPRHPAMLYEAAAYFGVFALLALVYGRRGAATPHGLLVGWFLTLVFSARVLVEFVKERQEEWGTDLPFTMGQALSVPAIAVGIWLVVRALRRGAPQAAT